MLLRMKCRASGDTLTCEWQSVDTRGKARFVRQKDRSLRGTWGHGASDSDGGPWVFVREEAR